MSILSCLQAATPRLVLSCLAVAAGVSLAADPPQLYPVVVTALREPQPLDRVVADVTVIDAVRIRDSAADSVEDLLRREAGIQLSRNGGPGQSSAILLRGGGAGNTLVLIDGVRVGSATLGQTDLSALALGQIERIEILRGPASSLYGADAVSGVVHIFTRRGRGGPRVAAHLAAGGLDSQIGDVSVSGSSGTFDYALGAGIERSDGVSAVREATPFQPLNADADGFERRSASLQAGLAVTPGHRIGIALIQNRLDAQYDGADFLPPTFAPDASADFRRDDRNQVARLDWRGVWSEQMATSAAVSEQRDDSRAGGADVQRYETRRRQAQLQQSWQPGNGQQWIAALEHLEESVTSTPFTPPERSNTGVVLAGNGTFGAHRWQVDLRHDRNSVYGNADTGKVGWAFAPAEGWTLRAVAGTAFRAPSFNELYFPGFGVETLSPERATSVEGSVEWRRDDSFAGLTVYRNRVRDLIVFEPDASLCPPDPAYAFGCARNVGRAVLQGATLQGRHRIGAWALQASLDFLDATDEQTGQRLPRRAAHSGNAGVDWAEGPWSAAALLVAVGARPDGGRQLGAYESVDLQARWRVAPHWRIETQLRNAFDRDIEPVANYRGIGRQAFVGLRYDGAGF